MTDSPDKSASQSDSPSSAPAAGSSSGGLRRVLLLVILVAVVGAFAYDQLVTKADFNSVKQEVEDMPLLDGLKKRGDHDGDGFITAADVRLTAGIDPAATEDLGEKYKVETYSWSRILPGLSYDLFVVYRKGEERDVMYQVTSSRPDASSLPAPPSIGEPGSVPNPSVGGLPPPDQRPDRDPPDDRGGQVDDNSGDSSGDDAGDGGEL
jgi:hypothetical protein